MAALGFSLLFQSTRNAEELDITHLEKSVISTGLLQPMEWHRADGKIFLIELAGVVKTIEPKSGKFDVVGKLEVTTAQENV